MKRRLSKRHALIRCACGGRATATSARKCQDCGNLLWGMAGDRVLKLTPEQMESPKIKRDIAEAERMIARGRAKRAARRAVKP